MLLEFSVENFLSFKDKVSFSMFANGTKGLDNNYVSVLDKKVLKTAAIYGANASGKSNLFKILSIVSNMIRESSNVNINAKLPIIPFKFSEENRNSVFEIKFIKNEIRYVYGFSANENEITEEYLYYYPNGRESKIFDRTNISEYSFPQGDAKSLIEIKEKTANNKFFLSTATHWNYSLTKPAYDFITQDLGVCFDTEELKTMAFNIYKNDKDGNLKKFALDFLKKADFNIIDYYVDEVDVPKELIPEPLRNFANKAFSTTFIHSNDDDKKYRMDYGEESIGTQVIFTLIPFISLAMEHRKVLIIDELDKSLHPF